MEKEGYSCISNHITYENVFNSLDEEQKNFIDLIESIFDIKDETVDKIYTKIGNENEYIKYIINTINYAIEVRPLQNKNLQKLLSKIKNDYRTVDIESKAFLKFEEGSVEQYIMDDNVNLFIKQTTYPDFDAKHLVKITKNKEVSYMQLMAFLGSIKCFKYAITSREFDESNLEHYAIAGGNIEIIKILEQKDSGIYDYCFRTAVKYHRISLCKWLLNNYKCEMITLKDAIKFFNIGTFYFLLKNNIESCFEGAFVTAVETRNLFILKYLAANYIYKIDQNTMRDAFMVAIEKKDLNIVKFLIKECKADVNQKGEYERTLLHVAAESDDLTIIPYLVEECGANCNKTDLYGFTALHIAAAENNNLKTVQYFVEKCNADVNARNGYGYTPIHIAALRGKLENVKYFIEKRGISFNVRDGNGLTPFVYAAENDHKEVMDYLTEKAASN